MAKRYRVRSVAPFGRVLCPVALSMYMCINKVSKGVVIGGQHTMDGVRGDKPFPRKCEAIIIGVTVYTIKVTTCLTLSI